MCLTKKSKNKYHLDINLRMESFNDKVDREEVIEELIVLPVSNLLWPTPGLEGKFQSQTKTSPSFCPPGPFIEDVIQFKTYKCFLMSRP